jgi:hypothetical protein
MGSSISHHPMWPTGFEADPFVANQLYSQPVSWSVSFVVNRFSGQSGFVANEPYGQPILCSTGFAFKSFLLWIKIPE